MDKLHLKDILKGLSPRRSAKKDAKKIKRSSRVSVETAQLRISEGIFSKDQDMEMIMAQGKNNLLISEKEKKLLDKKSGFIKIKINDF